MSTTYSAATGQHRDINQHTSDSGPRGLLLAGLPVTEKRFRFAGISTTVLEGGDGLPIVLLHGPGEHSAKWLRVIRSW